MKSLNVFTRGAAVLGLAGTILTSSGSSLMAVSEDSGNALTGTWSIQVTLLDCATGDPLPPGLPVNSLVTFHEGGTHHRLVNVCGQPPSHPPVLLLAKGRPPHEPFSEPAQLERRAAGQGRRIRGATRVADLVVQGGSHETQ